MRVTSISSLKKIKVRGLKSLFPSKQGFLLDWEAVASQQEQKVFILCYKKRQKKEN
jgi:hypothetical protein